MIKKIGVLTSGGDAPGMNAAIRAVTRYALQSGIEVVGINNGFKGLAAGDFVSFRRRNVADTLSRGGTILSSARLREFKDLEVQKKAAEMLKKENIDGIVVIGGDGSYRGALALTKLGINCVGIPGTIDNDIAGTDFTIGFYTALNTIVECIDKLRDTSSSHHRCSVVEVMGNHCGDLAIYSGVATGAEIVVTSETGYDEDEIIEKLKYLESVGKNHAIVIISEKICDVNELASKITKFSNFDARATILGHIQRGGSPTSYDRVMASRMGEKAVDLLINGIGGHCVCYCDGKYIDRPIEEALEMTRKPNKELYRLFERLL